ncbi:hypothetical protein ACFE04_016814 [Oxalis oulophora]
MLLLMQMLRVLKKLDYAVQGLKKEYSYTKDIKKEFCRIGTVVQDPEVGQEIGVKLPSFFALSHSRTSDDTFLVQSKPHHEVTLYLVRRRFIAVAEIVGFQAMYDRVWPPFSWSH